MSMKVMATGGGGAASFLEQRLNHRKRLLRLYMKKNEATRRSLIDARSRSTQPRD